MCQQGEKGQIDRTLMCNAPELDKPEVCFRTPFVAVVAARSCVSVRYVVATPGGCGVDWGYTFHQLFACMACEGGR